MVSTKVYLILLLVQLIQVVSSTPRAGYVDSSSDPDGVYQKPSKIEAENIRYLDEMLV